MIDKMFDREEANSHLNNTIMKILVEEMPLLKKKIKKLCEEVKRAKYLIYIFSGALFGVGIFFLIMALSIAPSISPDKWDAIFGSLGFGAASTTSFISVLLLNPIKKIQQANSDASQAEMVFYSWQLGVLLYVRAMDITDRDSIKEAAEKIEGLTVTSIDLLEKYYEIVPE